MSRQKQQTSGNSGGLANDLVNAFTSPKMIVALTFLYMLVIVLLLLGELDVSGFGYFRATDKVILLFVLLFLPFFIVAAPKFINTLTLKFGGGREVEVQLHQVSDHIDSAFGELKGNIARQVSTAEQCLWPMLAGIDPYAEQRWNQDRPLIIIGSKQDGSQKFFAHFLKRWIEKQVGNVDCEVRYPNGGSLKNFVDVKHRWIDLYIDYTCTCCQYFNIDHHGKSTLILVTELNRYCKPMGMEFLPGLGATEDYLLVMRRQTAEALKINSIGDLSRMASRLVFTADPEFLNRSDCWIGLQKTYGLRFADVVPCNITDRYALLEDDRADVFVGYETDPELQAFDMKPLVDNKEFFPGYAALPLVSNGVLDAVPGLREALEQLANTITTQDLIDIVRELSDGIRNLDDILAEQERKVMARATVGMV